MSDELPIQNNLEFLLADTAFIYYRNQYILFNPFHTNALFLYTLKQLENLWLPDCFMGFIERDQWHEMCSEEHLRLLQHPRWSAF